MSSYGSYRRGYQGQSRRSNTIRHGYHIEYVDVPKSACGLIVGKGGRNVKELKQMPGIQNISVDFDVGNVTIIGNAAGIAAAKQRIHQAVVLAVNSDGYFPDTTLTCLVLGNYLAIKFQRLSTEREYVVRTEQLDGNRQYFLLDSLEVILAGSMYKLALTQRDNPVDKVDLVAGFDPSKYMPFYDEAIRTSLCDLLNDSVCASIGVNFGKTFLSSVPVEKQGRSLTLEELNEIGYGRHGLRPEFVRNFTIDKRASLLRAIEEEYEELSTGKFVVVHCVSQKNKKRFNIKLRVQDNNANANPSSNVIKSIATAETYFSVLGIQPNAALRQIKIAFRRKALEVHPDKNPDMLAEKAMKVVNEAWECLKDDIKRASYARLPSPRQRPQNNFKYSTAMVEPFPEVESFQSVGRKIALCTILKTAIQSEFRTTIETAKDEAVEQSMLRKLQCARDERSNDGKMRFPNGTDDWLIVETIRYSKRVSLTNGTFILTLDEATEDRFAKSCNGVNISLHRHEIADTLRSLPNAIDKDGTVSRLLSYVRDLQCEATKISSLLNEIQ